MVNLNSIQIFWRQNNMFDTNVYVCTKDGNKMHENVNNYPIVTLRRDSTNKIKGQRVRRARNVYLKSLLSDTFDDISLMDASSQMINITYYLMNNGLIKVDLTDLPVQNYPPAFQHKFIIQVKNQTQTHLVPFVLRWWRQKK